MLVHEALGNIDRSVLLHTMSLQLFAGDRRMRSSLTLMELVFRIALFAPDHHRVLQHPPAEA